MVLVLKDQWIRDDWYDHDGRRRRDCSSRPAKSIGDPELRHMNQETGAIAYG
jgi:hypothetical protein